MATKKESAEKKELKTDKLRKTVGTEVPKDTFKVDDKEYQFTVGKYIIPDAGPILAVDALKDDAELERLVEVKSGVIKLVK